MADKDLDSGDGPSLEMPSLGSLFRRKKKGAPEPEPTADERPIDEDAPAPDDDADADSGTAVPTAADTPSAAAEDATASDDERAAAEDDPTTILDEPAQPADGGEAPAQPTDGVEAEEAAAAAAVDTDAGPAATGESADEARPLFADEVDDDAEPTVVVPAADADPEQTSVLSDEGGLADDLDDDLVDEDDDDAPARKQSSGFALPPVAARVAAIITGAIIGLLAVGLTYLALRGCAAVRDTTTCGEAGLPLMIAILILLVVLGSVLLGAWKVTDPSSTSFLAVGLLAVVALLFLIEVIFSPWMVVVIPLVAIGTYTLSQWVTEKFIEEADA